MQLASLSGCYGDAVSRLKDAPSPYLASHAGDPVHWHAWGDEPFNEAKERDVPVFISIGYAACHWCHVMQHESFQDQVTADFLNKYFVSIKVDREEHPDVDAVYMRALQAMRGHGGWPLTAISDPSGRPFFTGTYFPKQDAPGMPSFMRVLNAIQEAWMERREAVLQDAQRLEAHVRDALASPLGSAFDPAATEEIPDVSAAALRTARMHFDETHGGFGDEPKFPHHGLYRWLAMRPEPEARSLLIGALSPIVRGGIYDPIGGGMARYAVDAAWRVPHFEKMLYDNAQLLPRLAEATTSNAIPLAEEVVDQTYRFIERELATPEGLIATALDADSGGEEGAFYAWTGRDFDEAVKHHVGASEVAFARDAFGVADVGPFEGKNVPRNAMTPQELAEQHGMPPEQAASQRDRIRTALFQAREARERPATDDKALAGLQGLALQGLARTARLLADHAMLQRAEHLAQRALDTFWDGRKLLRRSGAGQVGIAGKLEDYAWLGLGMLELHHASGRPQWVAFASDLADAIMDGFVADDGGFVTTQAADLGPLGVAPRTVTDQAVPSDYASAAELIWRTARLRNQTERQRAVAAALRPLIDLAQGHPEAAGAMLTALEHFHAPKREVVVTGPDAAGGRDLWDVIARLPLDTWTVLRAPEPDGSPLTHGRHTVDGKAAAWVCENYACQRPIVDADELLARLTA